MTNAEALAIIVGLLMPLLVSWLKNSDWTTRQKFLFSVGISLVLGFATSFFAGDVALRWERVLVDTAFVFLAAQVFYKTWFEGTSLDKRLTGGP